MQSDARPVARPCWCGNADLLPFSADYARCPVCETLVAQSGIPNDISHVRDDENDLYGKTYFTKHQSEDYGLPDLPTRARADLPERCSHWLRTILKYKLPPGRSLELGSAHGGFVAMMRRAGFEARGLDLSPWLVEFSSKTFEVPVLCGMIEKQAISPASLDVVCLFDVLEHLPNPRQTIGHCLSLLKSDGTLAVQTPCYPEGKTLDEVLRVEPRFADQLKPREHIHIFSRRSVTLLFEQLGARNVVFERAIFGHYDMFPLVSRIALTLNSPEMIAEALQRTADARFMLALLDAAARAENFEQESAKRLSVIESLKAERDRRKQKKARVSSSKRSDGFAASAEGNTDIAPKVPLSGGDKLADARVQTCFVNLIGLDPPRNGGLARVAREACGLLLEKEKANRVRVFFVVDEAFFPQLSEWLHDWPAAIIPWGWLTRARSVLESLRPDFILHPLLGIAPFDTPALQTNARHIVSMPDALALDHPEFFDEEEAARRRLLYEQLNSAAGVITLSEYSRSRLIEHIGLRTEQVHVVNLAGDFTVNPEMPENISRPYLFYPANDWPHKRFNLLLGAFAEIRRSRPDLRLVLTGHHDPDNIRNHCAAAGLPESAVIDLGRVSDAHLAGLYQQAEAMLFTSQYEGFGMPLLEAMHFRCPVICEAITSIPEVAGDAALYVSGNSPRAWSEAFLNRLPRERAELVERGVRQAQKFSWKATLKQYRRALIASGLHIGHKPSRQREQPGEDVPLKGLLRKWFMRS
jgi:glycosyltransferase involved in cell wall biosynthesis/SAM-dependent methyltransferase